jgi:hypothetical protein
VKRALAIVGAVVMIVAAVFIRRAIDDSDGGSTTSTTGGSARPTIVCVTELAPVCNAVAKDHDDIAVVVEDAAATVDRLTHGANVDAWLTFDPWPDVANVTAGGGVTPKQVVDPNGKVLATSRLGIVIWNDRAEALHGPNGACPTIDWYCLGLHVGEQWSTLGGQAGWGPLKVGLPLETSALSLLLRGAAAGNFFATQQPPIENWASNDFGTEGFSAWYADITKQTSADPLDDMLSAGPGLAAAVGVSGADFDSSTGARKVDLSVLYPEPVARANVVFAEVRPGSAADRLGEIFSSKDTADLFRGARWSIDVDPVPPTGLPDGGVLYALDQL